MKLIVKILALLAVTGYLIYSVFQLFTHKDEAVCRAIVVELADIENGVLSVDTAGIAKKLIRGRFAAPGMKMNEIELLAVDSVVESDPYITEAKCYKSVDNCLHVNITCVRPVLCVMDDKGECYYLDMRGESFPMRNQNFDVPVATGSINKRWAACNLIRLVDVMRADEFWDAQIEQISVAPDSTVTLVPRVGDHFIRFGAVEDVADKFDRLRRFYAEGLDKVGWNRYKEISLIYDNQIICTRK